MRGQLRADYLQTQKTPVYLCCMTMCMALIPGYPDLEFALQLGPPSLTQNAAGACQKWVPPLLILPPPSPLSPRC